MSGLFFRSVLAIFLPSLVSPAVADLVTVEFSPLAERLISRQEQVPVATSNGLTLIVPNPDGRPRDRFIEVLVGIDVGAIPLTETSLRVSIFNIDQTAALTPVNFNILGTSALLKIDLRAQGIKNARLTVQLFHNTQQLGAVETLLVSNPRLPVPTNQMPIPVQLDVPPGNDPTLLHPVTFGVPFPAGTFWDEDMASLRLVNDAGTEIPTQKEIAARWSDQGSVKWVRFDACVLPEDGCKVTVSQNPPAITPSPVIVTQGTQTVTLTNAHASYELGIGSSPVKRILVGGVLVASAGTSRGLYVIDQNDRVASASDNGETMVVESSGPVAACVRFEGDYRTSTGEVIARHITRVELQAASAVANVTHTLILTRDTNELWLKEVGWDWVIENAATPVALFATSPDNASNYQQVSLDQTNDAAWMIQDQYPQFGSTVAHYAIKHERTSGTVTVAEGTACGDWAALVGVNRGLGIACQDAARQHPKEFYTTAGLLTLKLFSSRAGETLDFRGPALASRWNKGGWLTAAEQAAVSAKPSNALGWAKTHELRLVPFNGVAPGAALAGTIGSAADPIVAMIDKAWLTESKAMGSLSPRDPTSFPEAEAFLDTVVQQWMNSIDDQGEYGFVDYFAGPHYYVGSELPISARYRLAYALRTNFWRIYARSGDATIGEFIRESSRSFMDNCISHWGSTAKTKGYFNIASDTFNDRYPYYWEDTSASEMSTSSDLNQFLYDYYLHGYRRAADVVIQWKDTVIAIQGTSAWRQLVLLNHMIQAYSLTWDPQLRAGIEELIDVLYDANSVIRLTKDRPYSSTVYKSASDVGSLIDASEVLRIRRAEEMAEALSKYWWDLRIGLANPGRFKLGQVAQFLYDRSSDAAIPQMLSLAVSQTAAATPSIFASQADFESGGILFALNLINDTSTTAPAAWAGFKDMEQPVSVIVAKNEGESIRLKVRTTSRKVGGNLEIHQVEPRANRDGQITNLMQITATTKEVYGGSGVYGNAFNVLIPIDADAGSYQIKPVHTGETVVVASAATRMVIYAPRYWWPSPTYRTPASRYYFNVPADRQDPQIFFEGTARLFLPNGDPYQSGAAHHGWVDLPLGQSGLWSFRPVDCQMVAVSDIPPFFAVDDPNSYFEPDMYQKPVDDFIYPLTPDTGQQYVPGIEPGGQALLLTGARTLTLADGPFPSEKGTIEFYFQPRWSTFELYPAGIRTLFRMTTDGTLGWSLFHPIDVSKDVWPASKSVGSRMLRGKIPAAIGASTPKHFYFDRRALFEKGRWVHIAMTWGIEDVASAKRVIQPHLIGRIFINGKSGQSNAYTYANQVVASSPTNLTFGPDFDGAIDLLKVSNIVRYKEDFVPSILDILEPDDNTAVIFPFDGDLTPTAPGPLGTFNVIQVSP